MVFPGSSAGKESTCNAGDPSSIPGLGRSPGEGIGYPLQYSWASLEAQMVENPSALQETWVQCLGWEDPLEEGTATHSSVLDWRIPMDWGALWATVHGITELDTTEWLSTYIYIYMYVCMYESCPTLCDPIDWSMPGFPVHHQLPEFAHNHIHRVGDAIQSSHPLSSSSPLAFNLSKHQSLFQWVHCSHQVARVLELQLQHKSFQWIVSISFQPPWTV